MHYSTGKDLFRTFFPFSSSPSNVENSDTFWLFSYKPIIALRNTHYYIIFFGVFNVETLSSSLCQHRYNGPFFLRKRKYSDYQRRERYVQKSVIFIGHYFDVFDSLKLKFCNTGCGRKNSLFWNCCMLETIARRDSTKMSFTRGRNAILLSVG